MKNFSKISIPIYIISILLSLNINVFGYENINNHDNEISATVSVEKEEYLLGEPLSIKIQLINSSPVSIRIQPPIPEFFEISAEDDGGKIVQQIKRPTQISIKYSLFTIGPGRNVINSMLINKYMNLQDAGYYKVKYNGSLYFYKGVSDNPQNRGEIKISGTIKIKLKKGTSVEVKNEINRYLKELKSKDNEISQKASQALTLFDSNLVIEPIKQMLINEKEKIVTYSLNATWVLAKIETKQSKDALSEIAVQSKSNIIRRDAIREIGRWKFKECIPTLKKLLNDLSGLIKIETLSSIDEIGDLDSIPDVEKLLNDPDEKVRERALKVCENLAKKLIQK